MIRIKIFLIINLFFFCQSYSQKINLIDHELIKKLRIDELAGNVYHNTSFTILPLNLNNIGDNDLIKFKK